MFTKKWFSGLFWNAYIWTFLDFDVSIWSGEKILSFRAVYQQTPTDTARPFKPHISVSVAVCCCWLVSGVVWRCGVSGVVWGYLSGICGGQMDVGFGFGGWCLWVIRVLRSCRMESSYYFGTALKDKICLIWPHWDHMRLVVRPNVGFFKFW